MAERRDWPDIASGGALAAFAIAGLWLNGDNELGSARRMGPGYLPMLAFTAMAGLGAVILVLGIVRRACRFDSVSWRGLATVLGSGAAFVALIESAGLAVAICATTIIYSLTAGDGRPMRILALAGVLIAGFWFLFVYLLAININLLPRFG